MTELPTNPYKYKGASAAELGYDANNLDQLYFEWEDAESGQRVGIYETKMRHDSDAKSDAMIVVPASHDYRLEPLWMRSMDIIASRTGARVVGVETPGTVGLLEVGQNGSWSMYDDTARLSGDRQTAAQIFDAIRGNFRRHAEVQFKAMRETVGLEKSERILLLGQSMGAAVIADMLMLARNQELPISDIVQYEMVNAHRGYDILLPLNLMKNLSGIESERRMQGFKENDDIGHSIKAFEMMSEKQGALDVARKKLGQQGVAAMINGLGMARGKQNTLLNGLQAFGNNMPNITLVRGRESSVTSQSDCLSLAEAVRDKGGKVAVYEVTDTSGYERDMGHEAVRASIGRGADFANFLKYQIIDQKL